MNQELVGGEALFHSAKSPSANDYHNHIERANHRKINIKREETLPSTQNQRPQRVNAVRQRVQVRSSLKPARNSLTPNRKQRAAKKEHRQVNETLNNAETFKIHETA